MMQEELEKMTVTIKNSTSGLKIMWLALSLTVPQAMIYRGDLSQTLGLAPSSGLRRFGDLDMFMMF